jgi:hypothetical protein
VWSFNLSFFFQDFFFSLSVESLVLKLFSGVIIAQTMNFNFFQNGSFAAWCFAEHPSRTVAKKREESLNFLIRL